jgi:hypothetical protein
MPRIWRIAHIGRNSVRFALKTPGDNQAIIVYDSRVFSIVEPSLQFHYTGIVAFYFGLSGRFLRLKCLKSHCPSLEALAVGGVSFIEATCCIEDAPLVSTANARYQPSEEAGGLRGKMVPVWRR